MTGLLEYEIAPSPPFFTLGQAVSTMQNSQEWTYGILTLADGNNGASVLLCVKQGNYYIFDSHSRDTFGNMVANGTSVLLHLKTHNGFIKYIKNIGYQLHATQFEIMVLSPISSALHHMLQPTQHSQNTQNQQNKTSTVEICEQKKTKVDDDNSQRRRSTHKSSKKEQNKQGDIDRCQKRSTCIATNKYQQTQNSLNNSEQKKTKVHDDSSQRRRSTSNSNKKDHNSQS